MSLSKYLAKFHGERIDALKAVREALTRLKAGEHLPVKSGGSLNTVLLDNKAVKFASSSDKPEVLAKQMKRRGFLESILHDHGLAPKTHLIETKNKKYMVQPKADFVYQWGWPMQKDVPNLNKNLLRDKAIEDHMADEVKKTGMTAFDVVGENVGVFNGKPMVMDAGRESLKRAMTPAERKSALQKFIRYRGRN